MRRLNLRAPRIAGLLALALGAVALLAMSGVATAKDRGGDDHGHHGRHHHHHFREMREAGTISSFDATTGKLTIALPDGEAVTGLVTEETRIRCERGDDRRFDRRDHGDDDSGHGNEPGDDNGGQFEPGDDHGDNSGSGNSGSGSNGTSGGPGPSSSSGPGPSGEGNEGEPGEASCTVASLVTGAVVGEAELRLEGGVATFTEVDLGFDS
jgi:hypothetical protein